MQASQVVAGKKSAASPKVERNAEELKKKRAAAAADKHKVLPWPGWDGGDAEGGWVAGPYGCDSG